MMQYVASCDCGFTDAFKTERGARGGLRRHACDARFIEAIAEHDDSVEGRIRGYRRLAIRLAWQLSRQRGIRYDDAYADALIGLWQAAERWTPEGGASFATFAATRIRGEILDSIRNTEGPMARSPIHGKGLAFSSFDEPVSADPDSLTYADVLADAHDSITAWWDDTERDEALAEAMGTLDELNLRKQAMIRAYIGGETMAEIGQRFDVTESRVSQIWKQWTASLRQEAVA